ncbi:hypothetical protein [Caballeronia sp. INSB1]|uniref:hypothetical protein n=1 Tax=Caballeronia sp. INSB1 TaxID=2921751 RepID=UPI0020330A3A|nr:hypothetical protein [Caballeronia sp. INSB1]
MTTSLDAALLDVRKAYRLLADYQQRIIELLGFIRTEFDAVHYYHQWRNTPPRGFGPALETNNDAGRLFLPLLNASALWIYHAGEHEDHVHYHSEGDMLIDVQICSDSGFATNSKQVPQPVETSKSELAITLVLCSNPAPGPFNWLNRVWNAIEYPEHGHVSTSEKAPGYTMYREFVPLAALSDEQSAHARLTEFRLRASKKFGREV